MARRVCRPRIVQHFDSYVVESGYSGIRTRSHFWQHTPALIQLSRNLELRLHCIRAYHQTAAVKLQGYPRCTTSWSPAAGLRLTAERLIGGCGGVWLRQIQWSFFRGAHYSLDEQFHASDWPGRRLQQPSGYRGGEAKAALTTQLLKETSKLIHALFMLLG